jgi:hypothetical protein
VRKPLHPDIVVVHTDCVVTDAAVQGVFAGRSIGVCAGDSLAGAARFIWWFEGGSSYLGDSASGVPGLNNPPFEVSAKPWGWEVAGGFFDSI